MMSNLKLIVSLGLIIICIVTLVASVYYNIYGLAFLSFYILIPSVYLIFYKEKFTPLRLISFSFLFVGCFLLPAGLLNGEAGYFIAACLFIPISLYYLAVMKINKETTRK